MKKHNLLNRIISGFMGILISLTTVITPVATVYAADYYIRFLDTATNKTSDVSYIVEGTSINVEAKLPHNHLIDGETPFAVRPTNIVPNQPSFTIKRNTDASYTLTANAGSSGVLGTQAYTLDAIYSAILTSGSGSGEYDFTDPNDPSIEIKNRYSLDVVTASNAGVAITEDSSISFMAISDETADGNIAFSDIKNATGSFLQYMGSSLGSPIIKTVNGKRSFEIRVSPPIGTANPKPLNATVYIDGSAQILNGTNFKIEFRRQTINSLIGTVVSVATALEDTVSSVKDNPTFPGATDNGVPYVRLDSGDTLESIRSSFEVSSKIHRYNIDLGLTWSWRAENPAYQDYVKLETGTLGKSIFDIKQRPVEDMKGFLVVQASFNKTQSAVKEIPVVIYGTGGAVGFDPVTQTTGVPGTPPTDDTKPTNAVPANMDVYDGRADYAAYTSKPKGPYKFTSSLVFGSGRGIAEYAIIKNVSKGGEFDIFIDNGVVAYNLGDKIENIGKSKSIELVATKYGQCSLVVEFYNVKNELMTRSTITKQININDTRPSSDGRLRSLELNLVAGNNNDQKMLNLVYKGGDMDFSFDPNTNGYKISVPNKSEKIKLKPRIPTDTGAFDSIEYTYDGATETVRSGAYTKEIPLVEGVPKQVALNVKAQNGDKNTYVLTFVRDEPSKESRLKELEATRTDGVVGNLISQFSADNLVYNISVPFKVNEIQLKANAFSPWAKDISYDPAPNVVRFLWWEWPTNKFALTADYDSATDTITNNLTTIKVTVTAEDGITKTTYTLNFTRMPPSSDNTLSSLAITDKMGKQIAFLSNQKFDPAVRDYYVEIPYTTQDVNIVAQHAHPEAKRMILTEPAIYGGSVIPRNLKAGAATTFKNVDTNQILATPDVEKNTFVYKVEVESENDWLTLPPYYIHFTRAPASDDNALSALKVFDEKNKEIVFNEGVKFDPLIREYYINIPYSANTVNIEATNRHGKAQKMVLTEDAKYGGAVTTVGLKLDDNKATRFASLDVKQNMASPNPNLNAFNFKLEVTAENSAVTQPAYTIHVIRNEPDADTRLKNLIVTDQDNKPVDTFAFNQEQLEYTIDVPYQITRVSVKPEAISPASKITIDKNVISATRPSLTVELLSGKTREIVVSVTSESAETRVYTLKFTRGNPSTEARLSELKVDALTLTPKFNANILSYSVIIPEGTKGYTITPTAQDQFATITVNGKAIKSGEKSTTLRPIDAITTATVEVTAQDGRTKLKYIIEVRDDNLIEKSSNADLSAVSISGTSFTPSFKPAIETYDLAISPSTEHVDIKPRLADANATIKVLDGTKELQGYNGVYSTGIREDETNIQIEVVSQDKTKTKKYDFIIYKNDEDKLGIYKPITADMVDWTKNPINVDISKYAVVTAEVFNKLKTEFPESTMIFNGNDYSLSIKGSDISTLVPNTDLYDLSVTFNGPNNDTIRNLMNALDARNATISPVIVHFNHHGALPGPMNLTLSLGGFYKNIRMYWNYFNAERNRIDYYGYFKTNAQGTFAVPITHMSDYIVSPAKIFGSENKVGSVGNGSENIGGTITGKPNPSTGGLEN